MPGTTPGRAAPSASHLHACRHDCAELAGANQRAGPAGIGAEALCVQIYVAVEYIVNTHSVVGLSRARGITEIPGSKSNHPQRKAWRDRHISKFGYQMQC
jgi:hypothetical protein